MLLLVFLHRWMHFPEEFRLFAEKPKVSVGRYGSGKWWSEKMDDKKKNSERKNICWESHIRFSKSTILYFRCHVTFSTNPFEISFIDVLCETEVAEFEFIVFSD